MNPTLYGISNCDTVKKARAWLDARQQPYQFHDFKKAGVPAARLPQWIAQTGWEKLVNRQGTTWRKLPPELQARIQDAASATRLMLDQASLIKRPVVEWPDGSVTVGFDATQWEEKLP
jgi:Spx/MgsR family transcriptional regulator